MRAAIRRMIEDGADAVAVACAACVTLQRATAWIEEFKGPLREAGYGTSVAIRVKAAENPDTHAPQRAGADGLASHSGDLQEPSTARRSAGASAPIAPTARPPSSAARIACSLGGERLPAVPMRRAVLDALDIRLGER